MKQLSPAQDPLILERYAVGTLDRKVQNKVALQQAWGWPKEPRRPMLCLPEGMTDALGGKVLEELMAGILSLDVSLVILGKGSTEYGSYFTKLAKAEPHRVRIMKNEEAALHQLLAASDMALVLTDSQEETLAHCLAFGTVPIAIEHPMLEDYNPVQETGNAFTCDEATLWKVYAALVRACETYKFPFDWRTIQRHGMETK
jgi:starch synthase